ncbi:MAG TPA: hypothetical protein VHI78_00675, partial [Bacteroidales bacterium]|nr:hypothetical protein [Bacteroidales bacterium]
MRINLVILFMMFLRISFAQINSVLSDLPVYPFIHYDLNRFELIHDNPGYKILYAKFDTLLRQGSNRINIVHIGGSHIQADIYTHRMRQELQSFFPGVLGARGFFFPFKIAQTNSPSNLRISYTGKWTTCKNTQPEPTLTLGLSGITSALISDTAVISVIANYDSITSYDFNRVRVYCNAVSESCLPVLSPCNLVKNVSINKSAGFIQYDLTSYADTLNLLICRGDSIRPFELYGISLDNDDPGIVYNAIGVNGAMLKSYLQCNLFADQLKSLEPDWVIISIGTNEGNTRDFDEPAYKAEYIRLIKLINNTVPDAAVLLTVP